MKIRMRLSFLMAASWVFKEVSVEAAVVVGVVNSMILVDCVGILCYFFSGLSGRGVVIGCLWMYDVI